MLSASTMTAQRQERYGWRLGLAAFGLIASFFVAFSLDFAAQAATTERVVVNRDPGLPSRALTPSPSSSPYCRGPRAGIPISRLAKWAPSGASATRVTAPPLSRIGTIDGLSAATIRSIWSRRDDRGQSALLGRRRPRFYLFDREDNRDAFTAEPAASLRMNGRTLAGVRAGTWRSRCQLGEALPPGHPGDELGTMKSVAMPPNRSALRLNFRDLAAGGRHHRVSGRDVPLEVGDRRG